MVSKSRVLSDIAVAKEQPDKANRARERNKTSELLQRLEAAGRVVIERDDKRWRILEPSPRAEPPVL